MKQMDEILESLGESYGYLTNYLNNRVDYLKLEAAETSALVISSLLTLFVISFMAVIVLGFGSVALALYLGTLLDNLALGFLIVTLAYFVITVLVFLLRHRLITNPLLTMVISKFFQPQNN